MDWTSPVWLAALFLTLGSCGNTFGQTNVLNTPVIQEMEMAGFGAPVAAPAAGPMPPAANNTNAMRLVNTNFAVVSGYGEIFLTNDVSDTNLAFGFGSHTPTMVIGDGIIALPDGWQPGLDTNRMQWFVYYPLPRPSFTGGITGTQDCYGNWVTCLKQMDVASNWYSTDFIHWELQFRTNCHSYFATNPPGTAGFWKRITP